MKVAIADIVVPPRRREDLGDLSGLASSIEQYGLIHPIVVDESNTLVAGERRLEACKRLGWAEVDVRMYGELSEEERWNIELEENVRRKDLTTLEFHKNMMALREVTKAKLDSDDKRSKEDNPKVLLTDNKTPAKHPGGRPTKDTVSQERIADAMGISRPTLTIHENYEEAIQKYPEIAKPGVPIIEGIKIARTLDTLPEDVREQKREALRINQPNILADLTGRPPMPVIDPAEDASLQQEVQWHKACQQIRSLLKGLEEHNFLRSMIAGWSLSTQQQQLRAFKSMIAQMAIVTDAIEEALREKDEVNGGVETTDARMAQ
jgi:hypothetical protein